MIKTIDRQNGRTRRSPTCEWLPPPLAYLFLWTCLRAVRTSSPMAASQWLCAAWASYRTKLRNIRICKLIEYSTRMRCMHIRPNGHTSCGLWSRKLAMSRNVDAPRTRNAAICVRLFSHSNLQQHLLMNEFSAAFLRTIFCFCWSWSSMKLFSIAFNQNWRLSVSAHSFVRISVCSIVRRWFMNRFTAIRNSQIYYIFRVVSVLGNRF